MNRIAWLTDLHFDFLSASQRADFVDRLRDEAADAVLIGGDLAEAGRLLADLAQLDEILGVPIYLVLGNHDFYGGSISDVRTAVESLCQQRPRLTYLTATGHVALAPEVGLLGHDGWADGRIGDYHGSDVMLNDYRLIGELALWDKSERLARLQALGDEAAAHVCQVLPDALAEYEQVMLLTHVPPLREACWHEGQLSDDQWAPHFTCQAMGQAILEIMPHWPDRRLTVLCGHTHSSGICRPLPNVEILTGQATYGAPEIQRVFQFG